MDTVIRLQISDDSVYVLHCANIHSKGMNPIILLPATFPSGIIPQVNVIAGLDGVRTRLLRCSSPAL